jgi:hypothetical protein
LKRVSRYELNVDSTFVGLLLGDRQRRLGNVNTHNRQSERGDVKSILAGPTARIEHGASQSASGCQTHNGWLWSANIPRWRSVVVRRIPGPPRHPFVTGWASTPERIVREASCSIRQLRPVPANDLVTLSWEWQSAIAEADARCVPCPTRSGLSGLSRERVRDRRQKGGERPFAGQHRLDLDGSVAFHGPLVLVVRQLDRIFATAEGNPQAMLARGENHAFVPIAS